jgi:hypothetical protein
LSVLQSAAIDIYNNLQPTHLYLFNSDSKKDAK